MPNAKRILLLVTQAHWGGVQSFLVHFATDLLREGHEVLLASGGEGALFSEAAKRHVPTRRLRFMQREIDPIADLRAIGELKALYREFHPHAIHLNSSKMGVLGSIAAEAVQQDGARLRVVYRIGGWVFLEPIPAWKRWLYRAAERWSAAYKDIIITVNPDDAILAHRHGIRPRERIVTVPNGLDVAAFISQLLPREEARQRLGIPRDAFVIGRIANAYPTKGLLPYLDVVKRICDGDRGVVDITIGDGPEYAALNRKRDALGLTPRVLFTGQRADATTLYAAYDLFVLPSKKEGMPWTLLEAMAAGLPSIVTDVGACRWMVCDPLRGDAGIVVPKNDAAALHDAIVALKNDPDRRARLARAARRIVSERFTWDATFRGNREALLGL